MGSNPIGPTGPQDPCGEDDVLVPAQEKPKKPGRVIGPQRPEKHGESSGDIGPRGPHNLDGDRNTGNW